MKQICPLLKKECIEHKCLWYYQIHGRDSNTGQELNEWRCVATLIPVLLIDNSKQQLSTAVAVESFRNETVRQNDTLNQVLVQAINQSNMLLASAVEPASVKLLEPDTQM